MADTPGRGGCFWGGMNDDNQQVGALPALGAGILDREHTIAKAGFNRWLVPPAALCIHLCIGMAYGFSVFWLPLSRAIGLTAPKACPDHVAVAGAVHHHLRLEGRQHGLDVHAVLRACSASSAAIWGGWLERAGPRKAGVVAALCWGGGL